MLYQDFSSLIGNTPMLKLNKLRQKLALHADVYAKIEFFNPAGSIKDRAVLGMLDDAIKSGSVKSGGVIIEPTSGNTGIGLAAFAATRGIEAVIVMPENMSEERKKLMRAYGATLILTPASDGMAGAIKKAEQIKAQTPDSMILGQFDNPANAKAHYETTAPEIWSDMNGEIDTLVAGIGSGGTISGIGKFLKEKDEKIRIIGVEPYGSPFITQNRAGAHKIQGIGAGFIPQNLDLSVIDEVVTVKHEDAYECVRILAKTEGALCGISSGAALWVAIEQAKKPENAGKKIVVILPDGGDRYLSTELFD